MRTPRHLWIVGLVALIWNAGGAMDYTMTQIEYEPYLSMLTEPQRAYLDARPMWFDAVWAIGVWFAVLGSLLLLARSAWAGAAFLISILGLIASSVWSYLLATPRATEVMGGGIVWFTALVAVILIALALYSRAMAANGHLR